MTTNDLPALQIELDKAKTKDMNIEIDCTVDTSVSFLDVMLTNENGRLRTTVYHKPTAEPYYLPYTSDHPHRYHRNIPYSALIRAARLCSHVNDFNLESLRLQMSLLLGGYPPKFISNQFLRFFQVNNAMPVFEQLHEQVYQRLHQQLIHQMTLRQNKLEGSMKDPVRYPPILQKKTWDRTLMYASYTFETGPMVSFPKEFHHWWKKHYQYPGSPLNKMKIRLLPKTNRTLARSFIRKKPPRQMLQLQPQQQQQHNSSSKN